MSIESPKRVLDLINTTSTRLLKEDQITLNEPEVSDRKDIKVQVDGHSPYYGSVNIHYNRIDLKQINGETIPVMLDNWQNATHENIINEINSYYDAGFKLTEDVEITQDNGEYTLNSLASSLAWKGHVKVSVGPMKPFFSECFDDFVLDGYVM